MKARRLITAGLALGLLAATEARAVPVSWADWTSISTAAPGVIGTINSGGSSIGVNFSGAYAFAQTSGGINYWASGNPYVSSAVDNAPATSDIIALSQGGVATITFSQAVTDPLIAFMSWNGNTLDFNTPIQVLSYGLGYWGNGTPVVNLEGDGFYGAGEVHGVLRLVGTFNSISFSHTSENWHGFTVGLSEQAPSVLEPLPLGMAALGFAALMLARRR